jgi:hypothetical protein
MIWKKLLAEHKVHTHSTSKKELDALRAVITRDLSDAAVRVHRCPAFAKVKDQVLQRDFRLNERRLDHGVPARSEGFREWIYESLVAQFIESKPLAQSGTAAFSAFTETSS